MPKLFKARKGRRVLTRLSQRTQRGWLFATTALCATPGVASAQERTAAAFNIFGIPFQTIEVMQFALFAGALTAALASALWLIRERGRTASQNLALRGRVSALNSRINQLEALATAEGQRAVVWTDRNTKPTVTGKLDAITGAPDNRSEFLAFGRWLEPRSATRLDHAIGALRDDAIPFGDVIQTSLGTPIEVTGRTVGGSAVVRFANLSGERAEHARVRAEYQRVVETLETLQTLLDSSRIPVWLRRKDGSLTWVNRAYGEAVEMAQTGDAVRRQAELFGTQTGRSIAAKRETEGAFAGSVTTVVRGDRVTYDVVDCTGPFGSAGLALDQTEAEAMRAELNTTIRSHEETLDGLTTAVAMFDAQAKLRFHNQAFERMWDLDAGFLAREPDMSMFLDRMRTEGKLPEQPEWRRWKDDVLSAFQSVDPAEHWWYLPDGRTMRVKAHPHPKGGLTWVFENLTERIDLESRYETMVRVQGETLDHLAEGVAVFGSDGKLQLANPAFKRFWGISHLMADGPLHIADISRSCTAQFGDPGPWEQFAGLVTGFEDERGETAGRAEADGRHLAWMVVPLPNGQTMITFVDVTDSEQIERALRDRNEALERTAQLRDRFMKHVSYELRVPLTTISGFTELLAMKSAGPLTEKQTEYVGHVAASSGELKALTEDILDLVSADAGIIELDFAPVDVAATMREAASNVDALMQENAIELVTRIDPEAGEIIADQARLLRIMVNILQNAGNFAPDGTMVTFSCERGESGVTFKIRDQGPGIEEAALEDVFERFHTGAGGRKRGSGLGLALVRSFVRLHGGTVEIQSRKDKGTEVVMTFPDAPAHLRAAAE